MRRMQGTKRVLGVDKTQKYRECKKMKMKVKEFKN